MKFILTNSTTGKKQEVTRECVDRIKGKIYIESLIKKAEETGKSIGTIFEGDYDLDVINE